MKRKVNVRALARRIKMLVLDVDGVLTDGRMTLSERGDELKSFHTHDGMAVNVYIGDTELRGIVRSEVVQSNTGIARVLLAGART